MGQVLAGSRDAMIGRVKLAWWREALERLDREPPPPEPTLQALAEHILPRGVTGAELAGLEEGWSAIADPASLGGEDVERHAGRGALLFQLAARLLGGGIDVAAAGELWALVDLARRSRDPGEAELALAAARRRLATLPRRWPATLRPLGMLAVLAARDAGAAPERFEPRGSPARMLRMFRHRLTGR